MKIHVGRGQFVEPALPAPKRPGRPNGPAMPCGWCGKPMTAAEMREHFAKCPKKPKK